MTETAGNMEAGETPADLPSVGETPDGEGPIAAQSGTLTQIVTNGDSFNTLEAALKAAGLDSALNESGPFTVFAPTDEAFAALPPETLEALLRPENQATLQQILAYHVVSGSVTSDAIEPGDVATVEGNSVAIAQDGDTVTVSGARVVEADIVATNGVIHAIDQVLIPPGLNLQ
ncbi:MAG: fasciclin domain-containing protein [Cyanobacteria bacterium J069]|nr:MAG: fasciclin domain-containing protein [Cyanobacteria bacterium J069]